MSKLFLNYCKLLAELLCNITAIAVAVLSCLPISARRHYWRAVNINKNFLSSLQLAQE